MLQVKYKIIKLNVWISILIYYQNLMFSFVPVLPETNNTLVPGQVELKTFMSPMSLASLTSTHLSPYSESAMFCYPRLTGPRDLQIPGSQSNDVNVKVS